MNNTLSLGWITGVVAVALVLGISYSVAHRTSTHSVAVVTPSPLVQSTTPSAPLPVTTAEAQSGVGTSLPSTVSSDTDMQALDASITATDPSVVLEGVNQNLADVNQP